VDGADREHFFEAKRGELKGCGFGFAGVHFVDRHDDGFAAVAEPGSGFAVKGYDALLDIDDEDDDVGGLDGQFDLLEGGAGDDILGFFAAEKADAASIDEGKGTAAPLSFGGDAVAGDAGLIMNDGDAPADNAVEQGGLSDVRATDYGNQTWHVLRMSQSDPKGKGIGAVIW
jgi:hypothetical protein